MNEGIKTASELLAEATAFENTLRPKERARELRIEAAMLQFLENRSDDEFFPSKTNVAALAQWMVQVGLDPLDGFNPNDPMTNSFEKAFAVLKKGRLLEDAPAPDPNAPEPEPPVTAKMIEEMSSEAFMKRLQHDPTFGAEVERIERARGDRPKRYNQAGYLDQLAKGRK